MSSAAESWNILSYPAYAALRDGTRLLDGIAAWGGITASLNADGETDLVGGVIVTGNFFDLLGVTAAKGRLLAPQRRRDAGRASGRGHQPSPVADAIQRRAGIVGSEVRLNAGRLHHRRRDAAELSRLRSSASCATSTCR